MRALRLAFLSGLLFGGCLYQARESTDETVRDLAVRPFDLAPAKASDPSKPMPPGDTPAAPVKEAKPLPAALTDLETTAYMQAQPAGLQGKELTKKRVELPAAIPGAETPPIDFEKLTPAQRRQALRDLYPPLPPAPVAPTAQPGPGGKPYTLADLQQLAAANSPQLRQAASDLVAAQGNLIQAQAYPNPKVGYTAAPSNDGSTPSVQGLFIDQVVSFGGKIKLSAAAAEMDLRNAELALRRARSDLATAVRNAYFALLVARETVVVNKALVEFTDDAYKVQAELLDLGLVAVYEPAALRAQADTARLALNQSIATYIYAWKQLVATIGLGQLPLSEVAGRIDLAIPYYDYDLVREHVLANHTDVHTARNAIDKARYNLKRAQVTPYSDVEFNIGLSKEFALPPMQVVPTATISFTLPIWDQNKGAILAAEAALTRASEEPHRVGITLTNNLAAAYLGYKNNIDALERYRRYILPDQIRTYRGVRDRFFLISRDVTFGDVVTAQQTLVTTIGTYLTLLGNLWSSVVGVADYLQTDDLFQLAKPLGMQPVPQLEPVPPWPCGHSSVAPPGAAGYCTPQPLLTTAIGVGWVESSRLTNLTNLVRKLSKDISLQRQQGNETVGLEDSAHPRGTAPVGYLPSSLPPAPAVRAIPKLPDND
jgi:cobalt-zinc-cadmium efflux system outer membrane protein